MMEQLYLIPVAKSVQIHDGTVSLREARIIADDSQLASIIPVFEQELRQLLGSDPTFQNNTCTMIKLHIDKSLRDEQIQIKIRQEIEVIGGSCFAVSAGTSMLLQLMSDTGELPHCTIEDEPDLPYRGLMLDVARHWHSPAAIRKVIELCRFYRLSYLQLHLSDDQSFTFPLKRFPNLAKPGRHYTRAELDELVEYAQERGVQLVPEIDLPGHSETLNAAEPDIFTSGAGHAHENAICLGNEAAYEAVEYILTELCDVFKYSTYIHLGCDETKHEIFHNCPVCRNRMQQLEGGNAESLLRTYILFAAETVKRQGRKPIIWEGFSPEPGIPIPQDITIIAWESYYNPADSLAEAGYKLINSAWQPLYVTPNAGWPAEHIYSWNVRRWEHWWDQSKAHFEPIQLDEQADIIGAQFCSWENEEINQIELLRHRVPAMVERIWNIEQRMPWTDFSARLALLDYRLMNILGDEDKVIE